MSKNGYWNSDHCVAMDEDSSDDGYSYDEFDQHKHYNAMLYYVPEEMQPYVRGLLGNSARIKENIEPIRRIVEHIPIVQDQREVCMYENCNKLTSGKCGRCHVFLCIDSENDCFKNFHETD
ncbi:hypothetical protein ACI65C_005886 [Semiaphis heraclei]